jgi:hypothetical protein
MDMLSKFFTPGVFFLLTLGFGLWLSLTGKPYNGILFNIHKLIALGAVIITGIQVSKNLHSVDSQALIVALLILAGICVVALFASGALMSMEKLSYEVMLTIHRVAPILAAIAMATVVYLLGGRL